MTEILVNMQPNELSNPPEYKWEVVDNEYSKSKLGDGVSDSPKNAYLAAESFYNNMKKSEL